MICRHWRALARAERAHDYVRHLQERTFPSLREIPGFLGATLLRRDQSQGVEFIVITRWDSSESIRAFAPGPDTEAAVVPQEVREMMLEYDIRARHYDVIDSMDGQERNSR